MKITCIVLNLNNYEQTKKCLNHLKNQTLPSGYSLGVIVLDNGSSDNSTNFLEKDFPEYKFIFSKENLGFSKGVNMCLDVEKSDFFCLVNNDAFLEKNSIGLFLENYKKEKKIICGPRIYYNHDKNKVWHGAGFFSKLKLGPIVPEKDKLPKYENPIYCDFVSGCVMFFSKEVIELNGNFDEDFFFYGEDLDFCLRAKKKSINILYDPRIKTWHNIGVISKSRTNNFVMKNLGKSYFLIIKKHFMFLLIYGIFLFIFVYTPFRLVQIIKGGSKISSIFAWLGGGAKGLINFK